MLAKEYLQFVARIDTGINCRLDEIQHQWDIATRITAVYKDVGSSASFGESDKIGNAVAEIKQLSEMLNTQIENGVQIKKQAELLLNELGNENYATVLRRRYLLRESFDCIAEKMDYTRRNVTYLHGNALVEFQKILDKHNDAILSVKHFLEFP